MVFYAKLCSLLLALVIAVSLAVVSAKNIEQPEKYFPAQLEQASEDEGSMDNAFMNYLFARQMMSRLRGRPEVAELQKKRSTYWKQCAFNAVSCFGKK